MAGMSHTPHDDVFSFREHDGETRRKSPRHGYLTNEWEAFSERLLKSAWTKEKEASPLYATKIPLPQFLIKYRGKRLSRNKLSARDRRQGKRQVRRKENEVSSSSEKQEPEARYSHKGQCVPGIRNRAFPHLFPSRQFFLNKPSSFLLQLCFPQKTHIFLLLYYRAKKSFSRSNRALLCVVLRRRIVSVTFSRSA
jgi:hypothetical protein